MKKVLRVRVVATLFFAWAMMTATISSAQDFTSLFSFDGTSGEDPYGSLVQATDGNFYGTTVEGGASSNCTNGCGAVFKITSGGTLATLQSFDAIDGSVPFGNLVQVKDGSFYGTTGEGGASDYGTVFKITSSGTLKTLYSFCTQTGCTDGLDPAVGLVQATDGNFYGTTSGGGANGDGTVFKITAGGTLLTLHNFDGSDGSDPIGVLIQATNGDFYGTTQGGGASNAGTIFKMTPAGTLTTLYSFDGTGGAGPSTGMVQARDGNFYGTTVGGGTSNVGTVFRITAGGTLTVLHSFDGSDGANPIAGLIQATDTNFYGTTLYGGTNNSSGTIFKVTPGGKLTTLYSFCAQNGCTDGYYPSAGLVQGTDGTFYGTTYFGGISNNCTETCGTVFSLSVGLGPFVETRPTYGEAGAAIKILGNNLRDTTSVTFNGTAATFTVLSDTEITTTVPIGATTGPVQVTRPSGTLTSNVVFRVRP